MSSIFGGGTEKVQSTTNTNQTSQQQSQTQQQQQNVGQTNQTNTGNTNQTNTGAGNTTQNTGPGQLSLPYITQALQNAQGIYNSQAGTPYYQGDLYAGLNPGETAALGGLNNFASGTGTGIANTVTGAGSSTIGNLAQGGAVAQQIANMAMGNPTQYNINNASQYANNPYTQSEITAANTPIQQELNENAIPGLNMAAVGTGNTDSSRAAMTDAILQRDAGTQESNNAANILNNNYETGLNLSQTGLGQGLMFGNMAGSTLANTGTAGAGLLSNGYSMGVNNANMPLQTGEIQQQNQQGLDQQAYQKYLGNLQQPYSLLSPYWNMITNGVLGQSGVGTNNTTQTGNQNTTQNGTQNTTQMANANAMTNANGTSQGTSNTNSSITQPGPGVLGGLLGVGTGIASLFSGGAGGLLGGLGSGGLFGIGGLTGQAGSGLFGMLGPQEADFGG